MKSVAIINRSFWPESTAIGEALVTLTENLASSGCKVSIITQVKAHNKKTLLKRVSEKDIDLHSISSFTTSSSKIITRILELLIFSIYVLYTLLRYRPKIVYVATNPPIVIPFIVGLYCSLFKKRYIYHLQDIHPEATQVVTKKSGLLYSFLKKIDNRTIIKADKIITLTEQMRDYICQRTKKNLYNKIELLENPSVLTDAPISVIKKKQFVFCGNAGRLQRIPLLISSIENYILQGGSLPFVFAGGGVYQKDVINLAKKFPNQVRYLGILPGNEAAKVMQESTYGLMPIEDEVTLYAFPSKSSSYIYANCWIIAISGPETSTSKFIKENNLGYSVDPTIVALTNLYFELEKKPIEKYIVPTDLIDKLTPSYHAQQLEELILSVYPHD